MHDIISLKTLLSASGETQAQQLTLFALLNLGMIESLANGLISATDALRVFYNGENCLFVLRQLREKTADEIMSRSVQLPDLFDVLPTEEAHREFQRELVTMRSLCLKLLEDRATRGLSAVQLQPPKRQQLHLSVMHGHRDNGDRAA